MDTQFSQEVLNQYVAQQYVMAYGLLLLGVCLSIASGLGFRQARRQWPVEPGVAVGVVFGVIAVLLWVGAFAAFGHLVSPLVHFTELAAGVK